MGRINKYIGARYVPLMCGEWDKTKAYEPLSIVTHNGASYTSKTYVPINADITNVNFWVCTGNYNAQVEQYRREVVEAIANNRASIIDCKSNGFVADGVTDNTDIMTDLLSNITTEESQTLFFGDGVYIMGAFTLPDNVNIVGTANATIKIKDTTTDNYVIKCGNNSKIFGISIDCNNIASIGVDGILIDSVNNVKIENVKIFNSTYGNGVQIATANNIIIDSVIIDEVGNAGIYIDNVKCLNVYRCDISNIGNYGIVLYCNKGSSEHCEIMSNNINRTGSSGINTTFLANSIEAGQSYLTISKNIIQETVTHGIECRSNNTNITDNVILNCGSALDTQGIVCQCTDILVANNHVEKCSAVGIDMGNCARFTVANNKITKCGSIGIEINSCDIGTVGDNVVTYNNETTQENRHGGIHLHATNVYDFWNGKTTNTVVANNTVQCGANQSFGIYADETCDKLVISDNIVDSSGVDGEYYCKATASIVSDNLTSVSKQNKFTTASTWSLSLRYEVKDVFLTGNTTINDISINNMLPCVGDVIRLHNAETLNVQDATTNNGNIKMKDSTNKTLEANSILTLLYDGENWLEY